MLDMARIIDVDDFRILFVQFKANNEGCVNIVEFIEKRTGMSRSDIARVARRAGFDIFKRYDKFYIEA